MRGWVKDDDEVDGENVMFGGLFQWFFLALAFGWWSGYLPLWTINYYHFFFYLADAHFFTTSSNSMVHIYASNSAAILPAFTLYLQF